MRSSWLFFIVLVGLVATSVKAEIFKPESDERVHRPLALDNGLNALLISDPEAKASGAALTVAVGSDQDPDSLPGLAHLLEHMVFSGSARYPERGGFTHYMSRQGGVFNGYAASDHTSFHFQVQPSGLAEALDRFADFLIAPSLAAEDVDQEIQIIEHEFEGAKGSQDWEEMSVFRQNANASHPFSRFAMGNRSSFELVERDALLKEMARFFEDHYRAGNMKLVVLGSEPVDKLEEKVRDRFAGVPEGQSSPSELPPLFEKGQLPLEVELGGQGEMDRLVLSFPVEPAYRAHDVLPYGYIAELLGTRQSNRLRSELRDRGWISDLGVTTRVQAREYATFDIVLPLTEEGRKHRDQVIVAIFAYLETIREEGVNAQEYAKQQRRAAEQFHNAEQRPTLNYISDLAATLQQYPSEAVLSGPRLMERYDEDRIQAALDKLHPENVIVMDYQPEKTFAEEDPYSAASFRSDALGDDQLAAWQEPEADFAFSLEPEENPWVVEDHQIVDREDASVVPRRLEGGELNELAGFDVWFKQDSLFDSPRGAIYVALEHPVAFDNLESTVAAGVYSLILGEALNPLAEQGEEAGLNVSVDRMDTGLLLSFYGFTGKQMEFVDEALERIRHLQITPSLLEKAKADFELEGAQMRNLQPLQQLLVSLMVDANPVDAMPEEKLNILEDITRETMIDFHDAIWAKPGVTALIHGNYGEEDAREMATRLQAGLGGEFSHPESLPQAKDTVPEALAERNLNTGGNSAAVVYARRPAAVSESGPALLVTQMLNEHLFHSVREQQAKGYQAFATLIGDYEHGGVAYGVEAPGQTPEEIRELLEAEAQDFVEQLESLSESDFKEYRDGALSLLRHNRESLGVRSQYWWMVLQEYGEPFDEEAIAKDILEGMAPESLAHYARQLLLEDETQRLVRLTGE